MIPQIGGYQLCTNIASLQTTLTPQTSKTRCLKRHMKPVHTCKARCTLAIEPIDGIHTCARVATGVRVTFIDVIVTVMTSPARITLTVVAITLCQDKHLWQWHKTQVTSRHKYVTSTTDPPLYDLQCASNREWNKHIYLLHEAKFSFSCWWRNSLPLIEPKG